jgi:hypothetical protein
MATPLLAMPKGRVTSLDLEPIKPPQTEVAVSSNFFSTLAELATLGFAVVTAVIVLLALPSILRGFDNLLDSPIRYGEADAPVDGGARQGGYDFQDFAQSELSAADIRNQTEVMRALKGALDADLVSVRATIRRERAHAEQLEAERDMQ